MKLIVVTDIFGLTDALDSLLESISSHCESIEIVDPYDNCYPNFESEREAYACFTERVGLTRYAEKLESVLQGREESSLVLLGFSVGASAIWVLSEKLEKYRNTRGICFYSSQIRNYLDLMPKIEIDMYLAKEEPAYDVDEIMAALSAKESVRCRKTDYLHGFMNGKSKNFRKEGCLSYINAIRSTIVP